MNIINKVSKMDGIDEYVLLSRESIERLVEGSKRLDDKSQKLILQLEKWIYENDMIESPFDNYELQDMNKEQIHLQNQCDEIKKQLVLIKKTITLLNDIKGMPSIVRVECKENISKLMNWIYE